MWSEAEYPIGRSEGRKGPRKLLGDMYRKKRGDVGDKGRERDVKEKD